VRLSATKKKLATRAKLSVVTLAEKELREIREKERKERDTAKEAALALARAQAAKEEAEASRAAAAAKAATAAETLALRCVALQQKGACRAVLGTRAQAGTC
jgi:hypothetical protein